MSNGKPTPEEVFGLRTDCFQKIRTSGTAPSSQEALLSAAEQREQAKRCPCHGSDDYCPCQNATDAVTRRNRSSGWEPIDTAPKDGTHILVSNERFGEPASTVHWAEGAWQLSKNQMGEYSEWVWAAPTIWMPIPATEERDEYGRLARHRDDFDDDAGQFPTR